MLGENVANVGDNGYRARTVEVGLVVETELLPTREGAAAVSLDPPAMRHPNLRLTFTLYAAQLRPTGRFHWLGQQPLRTPVVGGRLTLWDNLGMRMVHFTTRSFAGSPVQKSENEV